MKKIILFCAIFASVAIIGIAQAKNEGNNGNPIGGFNGKEIKANIENVLKSDLKQRIQIDETSSGNIVWLTGAKIVSINTSSGTTTPNLITITIFGQTYKVQIDSTTNVVRQYWGKSSSDLSEFSVGDIINVYGNLDSSDYFLVHAKTVRNISIQKIYGVFNGSITTINSSTSFTMNTKKIGTTTLIVNTDANTKIYQGKDVKSFSDLIVGTKINVRGIWDKTMSKIQALLIRISPNTAESNN
jgi:hypothetical protein